MARPPKRGELADHVVGFRLTKSEWEAVVHAARVNEMTVGEIITEAINAFADDCGTPRPLARSLTVCRSLLTTQN